MGSDIAWGDVPTWVAAVAASTALAFAAKSVRRDRETLGLLEQEALERSRERIAAQASRVQLRPLSTDGRTANGDEFVLALEVVNMSDQPIRDAFVTDVSGNVHAQLGGRALLGPGERWRIEVPPAFNVMIVRELKVRVSLKFEDWLGVTWRRYLDGTLAKLVWTDPAGWVDAESWISDKPAIKDQSVE